MIQLIVLAFFALNINSQSCRFAPQFTKDDLLTKPEVRQTFFETVAYWEAKFMKEIGVDLRSGMTLDGDQLDVKTGLPFGKVHSFTAPSKESIHVAILAKALAGEKLANIIYSKEEALLLTKRKVASYEKFQTEYPGYGGFQPWMKVEDGVVGPTWDWQTRVPSLDNGQLFWAAYGMTQVLEDSYPAETDLIAKWKNVYQQMINNSQKIFMEPEGKIRAVANVPDPKKSVADNVYTNNGTNCDVNNCYLDDPYEGELFALMMYLHATWPSEEERGKMWLQKRAKLVAVDLSLPELATPITVQKGWWFSGHEQWKYLFMPYLDSPINKEVFLNCEKARTQYSALKKIPGMYASVTGPITSNEQQVEYWSAAGVPGISFQEIRHTIIVTPYSTMTLFLADEASATVWYHHMISGPAGQNQYGSTEGMHITGESVSSVVTWDTKITTLLGMMGGFADIVKKRMQKDNTHTNFMTILNTEWGKVFTKLNGTATAYGLPTQAFIKSRPDYTTCQTMTFPLPFMWGAATASYQIEGAWNKDGRGPSIWDEFSHTPGRVQNGDNGDTADDFYHNYVQDIAMMKSLNIKHFRFSISWTRLIPTGRIADGINPLGIQFYKNVINVLLENGIEPWVTLFHWDFPSGINDKTPTGGWLNRQTIEHFNDYADLCFRMFGTHVKKWITHNEPQTFTWLGYGVGVNAPGRCSKSWNSWCEEVGGGGNTSTEPYITAHHAILAHARAVQTYRTKYQAQQRGVIGMCVNSDFAKPWDATNVDDIIAVDTMAQFGFGWYSDPIYFGKYPEKMVKYISDNRLPSFTEEEMKLVKGSWDYMGLNHYTSVYAKHTGKTGSNYGDDRRFDNNITNKEGVVIGPVAESKWLRAVPDGFRGLIVWIQRRYNDPPIYIFENGCSGPEESEKPLQEVLRDTFRLNYYQSYINEMRKAISEQQVKVGAYFAWSLMDNFEWAAGYRERFGIVYVDYKDNLKRYPKDSAKWYAEMIKNGTISKPDQHTVDMRKYLLAEQE